MNRITTALIAALEALVVVAVGIGIPLVPLTILWATTLRMASDWVPFWRGSVDLWLLGHGVDLTVRLPEAVAATTGLPGAAEPFSISIALLGFAVITVLSGVRVGRRAVISGDRMLGVVVAAGTFALLTALLAASAATSVATPAPVQAFVLPTLVYVGAMLAGSEWESQRGPVGRRDATAVWSRAAIMQWPSILRTGIGAALRGALLAVAGIIGAASVVVAVMLVTHYATVTALYESLQAGILGGVAITLLQLALLPNLVIWSAAWLIGPGFLIGTGTSVAPGGTVLGAVPGLPVFGALPQGEPAIGVLGLLVPLALGALAGWLASRRMPAAATRLELAAVGAGIGVLAGLALGILAWWSGGAIGPGRLSSVGPDPWSVGLIAAAEIAVPAVLVLVVTGWRRSSGGRVDSESRLDVAERE
ncbi:MULTISPECIES: cell division protein PerM [unclassified Leifsonia]|uniref:cell division protein PerM n=1 Tax=unclassified Leifsonia TaxID=2663824 RepID=UPI0006FE5DFB|nr:MULTISPECIES: DUF6350 family protein [unclassified Leifsonia]KQX07871.1 hypothetical protein ASC59_09170 [Leifsonia sp. Root1293]KRA12152.1 hypothetical protein ASD61_09170 [Leifsonia sp. Root60]